MDLTTELVREYPSLQGLVGGFYAKLSGFNAKKFVMLFPVSMNFSKDYKNDLAFVLSVSQKVDSVFGFFASNRKSHRFRRSIWNKKNGFVYNKFIN